MNLYDGGNKGIPKERRFCFCPDGIKRFNGVIPDRQIRKGRGGAEDRRVKSAGPEVALGAVNRNSRDTGYGLAEIESMGAFKR